MAFSRYEAVEHAHHGRWNVPDQAPIPECFQRGRCFLRGALKQGSRLWSGAAGGKAMSKVAPMPCCRALFESHGD